MRPVPAAVIIRPGRRTLAGVGRVGLLLAACGAGLGGCARGHIALVEMNFRRLPATEALVQRESADTCCWWRDGDEIRVAMGRYRPGMLNELHRVRFDFSLALPGLPAGEARDYTLDGSALRCYLRYGALHVRLRSRQGIAGVWLTSGNRLRGRVRLIAQKESFHILSGWTTVGSVVLVGEFEARYDPERGQEIWRRSEADGMNRTEDANTTRDGEPDSLGDRPGPVRVDGPPIRPMEN